LTHRTDARADCGTSKASIVATINGHEIWPVQTRFGRLYVVGGTERAFSTLAEAEACAREKTAVGPFGRHGAASRLANPTSAATRPRKTP
jgi:hypothetical protein